MTQQTLTKTQLEELNQLLTNKDLVLPDFRRTVHATGGNIDWLRKNLLKRNPNASPTLRKLLSI
ncbi:MAG: hypothetical protein PHN51_10390 [Candidatus Nanopelagicales bacterium]|nr:hypothetical protein [Candidatus Nanopelagicales bacterium]